MRLIIDPYVGVGPVKFGMTVDEVRNVLGAPSKPHKRRNRDSFHRVGIFVDYLLPGVCEFVEMVKPARPEFQGQKLLGKPFNQMVELFRELDPETEVDNLGSLLVSRKLGIALYAESASKRPQTPVESVSVFAHGYYDDPKRRQLRIDLNH